MPKIIEYGGSNSNITEIFIQDVTAGQWGSGLTGLNFQTAGLVAKYHRINDSLPIQLILQSGIVGTFIPSGFVEVPGMGGHYQICFPDTAYAAGAKSFTGKLFGATNMAPISLEVQLISTNLNNASNGALNVNATGIVLPPRFSSLSINASGAVMSDLWFIQGSGISTSTSLDVNVVQWSGVNVASPDSPGYPKVTHKVGTGTGELVIVNGVVNSSGITGATANIDYVQVGQYAATGVWNAVLAGNFPVNSAGYTVISGVKTNTDKLAPITFTGSYVNTIPSGNVVNLNLLQPLSSSNSGDTVGGAMLGARAQAFGAWNIIGSGFNMFDASGNLIYTHWLSPTGAPTART